MVALVKQGRSGGALSRMLSPRYSLTLCPLCTHTPDTACKLAKSCNECNGPTQTAYKGGQRPPHLEPGCTVREVAHDRPHVCSAEHQQVTEAQRNHLMGRQHLQ